MHLQYYDALIDNIKIKIKLNSIITTMLKYNFLIDAQNIAIGPAKLHSKYFLKLKKNILCVFR
jgi:hypothetical protein